MPIKQAIIGELRNLICKGEYKPGQRLTEGQLAKRFGVSRTPIREVLNQLEKEGFIRIIPNVGAEVAKLSLKDIADIHNIMGVLEGLASRLATEELSDEDISKLEEYQFLMIKAAEAMNFELVFELNIEFHALITENSKNDYLINTRNTFRNLFRGFASTLAFVPKQWQVTIDAHRKIIDAFKAKNAPLAEFLTREHIQTAKNLHLEFLSKKSGDGKNS